MTMKTIISFTSPELPPLEQVGGKALTLMQMTAAGMPVPPGFVLTVQFFEPWLDVLKQSPAWKNLTKTDELPQAAKALQVLCGTLELSGDQHNALNEALKTFRAEPRPFICRALLVSRRRPGGGLLRRWVRNHPWSDGGRPRGGHPPFVHVQFR